MAISACACAQPTAPDSTPTEVSFQRLRAEPYPFSSQSGFEKAERLVIRDQAAWADVWARIYEGQFPKPSVPAIDFGKEVVIVAALGERPTGGYGILLQGASRAGRTITVRLETWSVGAGCGSTTAVTQPIDVAKLERRLFDDVRFEETATVRHCR